MSEWNLMATIAASRENIVWEFSRSKIFEWSMLTLYRS